MKKIWPLPSNESGVVTSVERQNGSSGLYELSVNGSFVLTVHEDMLVRHRLLKGSTIDVELYERIVREDAERAAYSEALRSIGLKQRSAQEIAVRLKRKGHEPEVIERVIGKLHSEKYIDDRLYAVSLARQRMKGQKKGRQWVEQELLYKGVSKEAISEALGQMDEDAELRTASELARKKWNQLQGETREKMYKTAALLRRRGFSGQIVSRALRALSDESPPDDLD